MVEKMREIEANGLRNKLECSVLSAVDLPLFAFRNLSYKKDLK
jgi:hypothetical protein